MQKYEAIEKGIANGDIKALRSALGSICYTSSDFSSGEFDEAVEYVKSKGIDIMDPSLVGPPTISSQKSSFTDDDFADAIFELKENFCQERIDDVKTIGKALYSKNKSNTSEAKKSDPTRFQKVKAALQAKFAALITKIQAFVSKWKDSKIKSFLLKLLQKAKLGLSKCKSLNAAKPELASQLKEDADKIQEDLGRISNNQKAAESFIGFCDNMII